MVKSYSPEVMIERTSSLKLVNDSFTCSDRVRIWRGDLAAPVDSAHQALSCCAVINTGHRANIFNARMLPHSTRMWVLWYLAVYGTHTSRPVQQ